MITVSSSLDLDAHKIVTPAAKALFPTIYFDCNLSNLLGYIFGRSDKIPPSDEETLIRQSVSSWTSEFLFATFSSLTFYDFFLPFLLLKCLLSSCRVVARLVTSVL